MVTAYLGLLNKKFGDELNPQAKEYMSTAVRGSERMRQLIDDLLQFSRIDSSKKELAPADMNKVAKTVENSLQLAIREAKAQVTIEELPTVMADEVQMTQVLQNLISNAIKFRGPEAPKVEVTASHRGHEWVFAVKDNGIGIDPKYHENLFKMFQRLHSNEQYPGTGIGLAISKKIIERHGGRIWVDSKKGEGSTFFFTIPESGGGIR
jgi:light-regulated signal transduction histidine kinase (bacteriophytochrome)